MSATPFYPPGFRATDADDNPLAGGYYLFFAAGTSTPKAVYSDAALATSLGTTVDLNIAGAPVSDSNVPVLVYPATGAYKIEIYSSADALLFTFDDIPGAEEAADPIVSSLPDTPVLSRTSTFSVTVDNRGTLFNLNPTGGSFAATLPSAVAAGDKFRVGFRHNGTANTATILTTLSQTIRRHKNSTSWTLKSQGECLWLVSDGSDWSVDAYTPPLMDGATPFFTVTDRLTAPPSSPTGGARYIVNGTPTGVWLTLGFAEHDVAEADGNGSWIKYTPVEGWFAYVTDENLYTAFVATAWADQTGMAAAQSSVLQTAVFEHQETNGTVGGMATDGAWTKRTLNTSVQNDITGVSLATSQITLPVGKYLIDFSQHLWSSDQSPTYGDQDSRIKVISGTATPDPIKGIAGENDSGVVGSSLVTFINAPFHSARGILTVTAEAVIELQYFHNNAGVSTAELGTASSEADAGVEMYARVVILSLTALQGAQGIQGIQGLEGLDAAYAYQWSTLTSGDPGAGKVLGNNATPASITQINISETDANAASLAAVIATWDDSTSTIKARLKLHKEGAPQNFMEFLISGAGTDQGDYWTFPVTYVGSGGTLANSDNVAVLVIEKGDKGDTGATGPTGSTAFNFDSTTTDADPGSGDLRLNNATPASATEAYIDTNNRGGTDVSAWLDTFDDLGVSAGRGQLHIFDAAAPTTVFRIYNVTGSVVDGTGYRKVTIAHVAGAGSFTNGNELLVAFFARGNSGAGDLTSANNLSDVADAATAFATIKQAASAIVTGVVELATDAETITGTDTGRATTPANIAAVLTSAAVKQGKHTVWIPASAMIPRTTNGAAPGTAEMATNKNMFKTLDFDTTTQEFAQFEIAMPKSWNEGTVTFQPVLSHASGSGNVVFGLAAVARSDDDAGDVAFGTAQTSDKTVGTANDIYVGPESAAITIAGTPAEGDVVQFQINRTVASDNLGVDARLHGIKLYITTNAANDA